jgi:hypothetical protein
MCHCEEQFFAMKEFSIWRKTLRAVILLSLGIAIISPPVSLAAQEAETEITSTYLPTVAKNFQTGPGNLKGTVVDAIFNTPVNNALVCVTSEDDLCFVTAEDGKYHFNNIAYGKLSVEASHVNYLSLLDEVSLAPTATKTLDFALSPLLADGEYRIVLTWGNNPKDLDAHLWLPFPAYPHLSLDNPGNCDEFPDVCLDRDDTDGNGPETISIKNLAESGTYTYAVLNFSYGYPGVPDIIASSAKVRVYGAEGLIAQFSVPKTGAGDLWYVFDFDTTNKQVVAVNCITWYPSDPDLPVCGAPLNPDRVLYIK